VVLLSECERHEPASHENKKRKTLHVAVSLDSKCDERERQLADTEAGGVCLVN
jgi:hypothetical protein